MEEELIRAVINNDIEYVEILIDAGVDTDYITARGGNALILASVYHHTEVVELLLNSNANPNLQDNNGSTALILASLAGKTDIVRLLLTDGRGVEVNIHNDLGWTALMKAAIQGYIDIVRLLLDRGALVDLQNNNGWTALILSSNQGYIDIVRLLLDRGANVDLQDNNGATALMFALDQGRTDIVEILNRYKSSRNIQRRFRGNRARTNRKLKARQRLALSQSLLADDLTGHIGNYLSHMPYNPEVTRRMLDEQDDPYTEWLQDRSQLGSGKQIKESNRATNTYVLDNVISKAQKNPQNYAKKLQTRVKRIHSEHIDVDPLVLKKAEDFLAKVNKAEQRLTASKAYSNQKMTRKPTQFSHLSHDLMTKILSGRGSGLSNSKKIKSKRRKKTKR